MYIESELLSRKVPKSIISWITILIIIFILTLIFINIPFNTYKSFNGYIFKYKKDFYIEVLVNKSDFPINKKDTLYIKDKKYNYKVINIDKKKCILDLKLDDSIKGQIVYVLCFIIVELAIFIPFVIVGLLKGD